MIRAWRPRFSPSFPSCNTLAMSFLCALTISNKCNKDISLCCSFRAGTTKRQSFHQPSLQHHVHPRWCNRHAASLVAAELALSHLHHLYSGHLRFYLHLGSARKLSLASKQRPIWRGHPGLKQVRENEQCNCPQRSLHPGWEAGNEAAAWEEMPVERTEPVNLQSAVDITNDMEKALHLLFLMDIFNFSLLWTINQCNRALREQLRQLHSCSGDRSASKRLQVDFLGQIWEKKGYIYGLLYDRTSFGGVCICSR